MVRGLVDCLLAVVAQRHGATLVHRDTGLARLADLLPGLSTHDLR
jgi:predicted nucleic acid-binding protein